MRASVRSTFDTSSGSSRRLERDVRERLGRRHRRGAVAAHALGAQRLGERARRSALPGLRTSASASPGLDLEREIERAYCASTLEQVVENGQAGGDVRGAAAVATRPAPARAGSSRASGALACRRA